MKEHLFATVLLLLLVRIARNALSDTSLRFRSLDWVVSLFRRIFSLYENLPEEGGKRNTVPKQEEALLKSIKSTLDIVCMHLSDPLFDLVLKLVFEYATTNAKSNSVRVSIQFQLLERC